MKVLFLKLITFVCLQSIAQDWGQISDFTGVERDDGTAFIIGDTAYFGTGITPWFSVLGDFHGLNLLTDEWLSVTALPVGKERQYASSFSGNQNGFVFGGYNGTDFVNDLWKYNPISNSWSEMASLPGLGRSGASCFVLNDTAFIIGGKTQNNVAIEEVWAYAILSDTWVQKNSLPFGNRWRASATQSGSKGYLIFGRDEVDVFHNQLYEYNAITDQWTELSIFPIPGRSHASLLTVGNELIICFGADSLNNFHNDLWAYNFALNIWNILPGIPSVGRRGGMAVVSNQNTIYYTTGLSGQGQRLKETWKYNESLSIWQSESSNQEKKLIKIVDLLGRDTKPMPNTMLIYIYSDGTRDKIFKVE